MVGHKVLVNFGDAERPYHPAERGGAGDRSRTGVSTLEGSHNSRYTTPAQVAGTEAVVGSGVCREFDSPRGLNDLCCLPD